MNSTVTATPPKLFFNSVLVSKLASISSAILLLIAYTIPWLSWLTWVAFIPFILSMRGQKRFHGYANVLLVVLIYLIYVIYVTTLWKDGQWLLILAFVVPIIILTSEIQLFCDRFPRWGWAMSAVLWTGIFLIFGLINPQLVNYQFFLPLADAVTTVFCIIPVSQPIFQFIAGTYWGYLLLLVILLINFGVAEVLLSSRNKGTWILVTLIIGCSALLGLWGGPVTDLPLSTPESQGMNSKILARMGSAIPENLSQIRSVVVVRHGHIVYERYYQNYTPYSFHLICSVTKSFTGALTGIALQKGYIQSLYQTMAEFFPEYISSKSDPRMQTITIQNLLSMTSGIEWDQTWDVIQMNQWVLSKNWLEHPFTLSMLYEPGAKFNYCDPGVHLLSGIINQMSHTNHSQFADRHLFGPLGIYRRIWSTDPQRNNFGGATLMLKSRDMAKFGCLYLKKGMWKGKQIIPAAWVNESTLQHSKGGMPHREKYGYLFWVTTVKGHSAYFAGGYGGQYIYCIPGLDLVVVITSNTDRHHEENRGIIPDYIIPSIKK